MSQPWNQQIIDALIHRYNHLYTEYINLLGDMLEYGKKHKLGLFLTASPDLIARYSPSDEVARKLNNVHSVFWDKIDEVQISLEYWRHYPKAKELVQLFLQQHKVLLRLYDESGGELGEFHRWLEKRVFK